MLNAHLSSALAPVAALAAPPHPTIFRELTAPQTHPLHTLRGVVLLGGSVWMSGLRAAIGRSVLDLPVTPDKTLLDIWCERIAELGASIGRGELPTRVLMAHGAPLPGTICRGGNGAPARRKHLIVERDEAAYRGTGGVLRDLTMNEPADAALFVANAAQLPLEPLAPLVKQLAGCDADLSFIAHYDGTASRLMLIRSHCLRALPRVGFVDLMEQGLPVIAREHRVSALHRAQASSLPVRTREGYIAALQRYHRLPHGLPGVSGEEWRSSFALVEDGADVHPSACVHDAVVLSGGRVERGAVVARSVVCPGGVVPRGAVVVDQLVGAVPVEQG